MGYCDNCCCENDCWDFVCSEVELIEIGVFVFDLFWFYICD